MKTKKPKKSKPSLLVELAKRKAEAQKAGQLTDGFGKFKNSSSFAEKPRPPRPRGGRNGQGKPS